MKDLASIENSRANKVWSKTVDAPLEEGIMRTTWSNINLFIKTMLQEQEGEALPQTGRIRSNEDNINVITENEGIAISIEFENVSIFSIKAINLQTSRQLILCPESMHQAGEEIYQYSLNPGVYVIAVEIDGNINAKKVIVK